MTATMSAASRSHKHIFKRLVSLLMVFTMLFSVVSACVIQTSAKTTSSRAIVRWVATYSQPKALQTTYENDFYIRGNALWKKKVTISVYSVLLTEKDVVGTRARDMARFQIMIFDQNGRLVDQYFNLKHNSSFYLPAGAKNYRIRVTSFYIRYNCDTYANSAAEYGRYNLKY